MNLNVKVDGENLCKLSVSAVKHQRMVKFFLPQRCRERGGRLVESGKRVVERDCGREAERKAEVEQGLVKRCKGAKAKKTGLGLEVMQSFIEKRFGR